MTRQEALQSMTDLHAYALDTYNPSHPFVRDLAVWLQRVFGAEGAAAVQANARARNAQSRQVEAAGAEKKMAVFVHPKKAEALTAEGPGEQKPKLAIAAKRPSRLETETETEHEQEEALNPQSTESQKVVAADDTAAPLDADDMKDLAGLKARTIASRYHTARIEATLRQVFHVPEEEIPAKEMQRAAMLKTKVEA